MPLLGNLVSYFLDLSKFPGGTQQDASECATFLLGCLDNAQDLRSSVFGSGADAAVDDQILCTVSPDAQVAAAAGKVNVAGMLMLSLTGDAAIAAPSPALMLRVENTYELGGVRHSVTARADWGTAEFEVTVAGTEDSATYRVASLVAHEAAGNVSADQRTRSGHCVTFARSDDTWFEMNDNKVTRLSEPPEYFPYLVFCASTRAGDWSAKRRGQTPAPCWIS